MTKLNTQANPSSEKETDMRALDPNYYNVLEWLYGQKCDAFRLRFRHELVKNMEPGTVIGVRTEFDDTVEGRDLEQRFRETFRHESFIAFHDASASTSPDETYSWDEPVDGAMWGGWITGQEWRKYSHDTE